MLVSEGKIIQGLWDKHVANPPVELPLNQMENLDEELVRRLALFCIDGHPLPTSAGRGPRELKKAIYS